MHTIATTALVGTARQDQPALTTDSPVDTLIAQFPAGEAERALLLSAGALTIYRQAGKVAESIPEMPVSAKAEQRPACSLSVSMLLHRMLLGEHNDLLPEALERLDKAGLRLPYELLPMALALHTSKLRDAVYPVLGERGSWLSQFNPAWSWVNGYVPHLESAFPSDAETIWQEGTTTQRCEILRRLRAIDAGKARAWLESAWKQEKAEVRLELLQTLEIGLSAEVEPFLERILDDRAASVKSAVPRLLARIPTSAFAERMRSRVDAILTYTQGKLKLKLPTTFDITWQRDGIAEKPQAGLGERAWWLIQLLAFVPPAHCEEQWQAGPGELIAAADADKFGKSIIEGWSRAAQLFSERQWLSPLWDWWQQQQGKKKLGGTTISDMRDTLIAYLPSREAEAKVQQMFINSTLPEDTDWDDLLAELPIPWSGEFSEAYLRTLRNHVASLQTGGKNYYPYSDPWYNSLERAALGLPASCFAAAVTPWALPNVANDWQIEQWRQQLQVFTETLRTRQRLIEEIKL